MPRARPAADTVVGEIVASSREMHVKIVGGRELPKPPLKSPSNVRCTPNEGYFEMAAEKKERTLTVSTVEDVRADAAHDRASRGGQSGPTMGPSGTPAARRRTGRTRTRMDVHLPEKLKHPEEFLL